MSQSVVLDLTQGTGSYTSSAGSSTNLTVYSINAPTANQLTDPNTPTPIIVARVSGGPVSSSNVATIEFDKDPNTGLNTNLIMKWPTSAGTVTILDANYTVPGKYNDTLNDYVVSLTLGTNFPNLYSNVNSIYLQKYSTIPQCPALGGVSPSGQTGNLCVYDANKVIFSITSNDIDNFDINFDTSDAQTLNGKNYLMSKWCSQMDPPNPRNSSTYCQNNQCLRYSNQAVCQTWCQENQDLCNNSVTKPYCSSNVQHLQDTNSCLKLCEDGNCEDFLTNMCSSLPIEEATGKNYGNYCGCFLDQSVYNDFFSKVQDKLPFLQVNTTPGCFYPPCSTATVKKGNVTCPNINNCIQGIIINENGDVNITDKNDIVINQTGECANIKLSPQFCSDGQYLTTGPKGEYCAPCPDGQTNNSDKTGCIPLYYNCINDTCMPTTDSTAQYSSLSECLNAGCKGVSAYSCVNGQCVPDAKGKYAHADCGGECGGSKPKTNYIYWVLYGVVVLILLVILVRSIFKKSPPVQ